MSSAPFSSPIKNPSREDSRLFSEKFLKEREGTFFKKSPRFNSIILLFKKFLSPCAGFAVERVLNALAKTYLVAHFSEENVVV